MKAASVDRRTARSMSVREVHDKLVRAYEGDRLTVDASAELDHAHDLMEALDEELQELRGRKVDENTSDGYHTFKELYRYRLLYNAALFNAWGLRGFHDVHKSKRHSDGELAFDGGWFVVVADLPTDDDSPGQITNHYEMADWDLFHVPVRERAAKWDGHTPANVAERLERFLRSSAEVRS